MSLLVRLNDFQPSTLIQSAQVDAEFNQLVQALSGISLDRQVFIKSSQASIDPPALKLQSTSANGRPLVVLNPSGNIIFRVDAQGNVSMGDADAGGAGPSFSIIGDSPSISVLDLSGDDLTISVDADVCIISLGVLDYISLRGGANDDMLLQRPIQVNGTVALSANNRFLVNHSESPQTDVATSLRSGATGVRPLDVVGEAAGTAGLFRAYEDNDATERFRVSNDGLVETRAGNGATPSTSFISLAGTYDTFFADAGNNAGSADTDLHSKTIEANVLGQDGDWVRVAAGGNFAANANTKRLRLSFAGTTVIDTGNFAPNNLSWMIDAIIIRASSSTARVIGKIVMFSGLFADFSNFTALAGLSFTGTNILKTVGNGSSANDVVAKLMLLEKGSNQ